MNDDWRVQATCPSTATAAAFGEQLRGGQLEHELESTAGDRVVVSVDGHELFLYAGTRPQAEKAADAIKALAASAGASVRTELRRWHPASEEWADADLPLPASEAAVAAEHAEVIERERAEAATLHYSEYEVRVETGSRHETIAVAERLRADGIPSLRRWNYLLVGATDEQSASALAARISGDAPAGTTVTVEASLAAVAAETPANPFAVFGGLGV
jgi:hypothetical protein